MTLTRFLLVLTTGLLLAAAVAGAEEAPPRAALCAACHGRNGVPVTPATPVIWGQNEGYLYLQLRDFKLGNRASPIMAAVAAGLQKPDMQALAAYFAAQPWPGLGQPAAAPEVAQAAQRASEAAVCQSCHLDHWQGNSTTPRLGGQDVGYLRATMAAFRDGTRANNPWMTALLKTYTDPDIEALARYLAGM